MDLDETLIKAIIDPVNHDFDPEADPATIKVTDFIKDGKRFMFPYIFRPELHLFLTEMSQYFEIIAYTYGIKEYAHKLISIIDPNLTFFSHLLYRKHNIFYKETRK